MINYLEKGIYEDRYTPSHCFIVILSDEHWTYVFDLECQTEYFTHDKICENVVEMFANQADTSRKHIRRFIPNNLGFFLGGYLGQVPNEIWNMLRKQLQQKLGIFF